MKIPWRLLLFGAWALRGDTTRKGSSPGARAGSEPYEVNPNRPWGPGWNREVPKGLSASHRRVGIAGTANARIEAEARRQRLSPAFTRIMLDLARTESGAMMGRPARPPYNAADGYGAFQWNQGAWEGAGFPGKVINVSPTDEIRLPISRYAELWRMVSTNGGDDVDAARHIRVWHRSPVAAKRYRKLARDNGRDWPAAWSELRDEAQGWTAKSVERTDADMDRLGYA